MKSSVSSGELMIFLPKVLPLKSRNVVSTLHPTNSPSDPGADPDVDENYHELPISIWCGP